MEHQDRILNQKYQKLTAILKAIGRVVVAYSGGVDSTFLLKVAGEILQNNVLAVTALSETFTRNEQINAEQQARAMGIKHLFVESREMDLPEFVNNPADRCYTCKYHRFGLLVDMARKHGFEHVVDGENADDQRDYRPGRRAAQAWGVKSPLKEADFCKADIRAMSKAMNLSTWNTPSSACLASRIPYDQKITVEKLKRIEAAEKYLQQLGMSGQIRVRHEGDSARIEVDTCEISRIADEPMRQQILHRFKSLGFKNVVLDLKGYTMGSLNRNLLEDALAVE